MPVCLHCGEIAAEGALFCTKCGFTLPQGEPSAIPMGAGGSAPTPAVAPSPPVGAPMFVPRPVGPFGPVTPPGAYAYPVASVPGAVGPVVPPPSGKYCVRCGTLISRPAVYCPVCQSPQT